MSLEGEDGEDEVVAVVVVVVVVGGRVEGVAVEEERWCWWRWRASTTRRMRTEI